MAADWYVLQTYSGHENKIEKSIRVLIEAGELDKDVVRDVKVPSEEVVEVKDGKKRTMIKKIIPGYILLELDLSDTDWKKTCSKIKTIQGVTGFVGTPADKKPHPLQEKETRAILQRAGEIKGEKPIRTKQTFAIGEQVKIIEGAFESFTGVIEEVNLEKNKLRVSVGIFGRNTPLEIDILHVEKI